MEDREIIEALVNCATGECPDDCPMRDEVWKADGYVACRELMDRDAEIPVALIDRTIELLKRLMGGESA